MFSANMLKQRATLCAVMTLALSVASSALGAVAPDISGALQQQQQQQQTQASQVTTQKLPNVNIYISKNEVKKMLGIETRINYVVNGNIETYPLGFTIPLGYNQSDLVFTWQNLGPTNVNYSISLSIGNIQAVDTPLINITRSGLIPRHEQVFKITLPCSGRVTDEVDVQVLINISGLVADESDDSVAESAAAAASSSTVESASVAVDGDATQPSSGGGGGGGAQHAAAANASTPEPGVQADEAAQPRTRLVSHTLAIKRKKICTMHPVQVPVPPSRAPHIIAATSAPQQQQQQRRQPHLETAQSKPQQQQQPALPPSLPQQQQQQQQQQQPHRSFAAAEQPLAQQHYSAYWPPAAPPPPQAPAHTHVRAPIPHDNPLSELLGANSESQARHVAQQQHQHQQQQQAAAAAAAAASRSFMLALLGVSLLVSGALVALVLLSSAAQKGASIASAVGGPGGWPNSAGAAHRSTSSHPFGQSPLDKLQSITGCWLRRSAGATAQQAQAPPPHHRNMTAAPNNKQQFNFGSLSRPVVGLPKSASPSMASAAGKQSPPSYCYKPNASCAVPSYYSQQQYNTMAPQMYQQQQQQLPIADLLGAAYPPCHTQRAHQQPQQQQQYQQQQQQYPIYNIATDNTSQTTRLIWQKGNGTSADGFTIDGAYMPLSNAARSESGSVYQTIY